MTTKFTGLLSSLTALIAAVTTTRMEGDREVVEPKSGKSPVVGVSFLSEAEALSLLQVTPTSRIGEAAIACSRAASGETQSFKWVLACAITVQDFTKPMDAREQECLRREAARKERERRERAERELVVRQCTNLFREIEAACKALDFGTEGLPELPTADDRLATIRERHAAYLAMADSLSAKAAERRRQEEADARYRARREALYSEWSTTTPDRDRTFYNFKAFCERRGFTLRTTLQKQPDGSYATVEVR